MGTRLNKQYDKIVRDRIPEIILFDGKTPKYKKLDEKQAVEALIEKFREELNEFQEDNSIEELADLLSILNALAKKLKYRKRDIMKVEKKKTKERGGFEDNIFLESVYIKNKKGL